MIHALASSYAESDCRAARRLASCGTSAKFYINPALGKVHPWFHRCKHRLCPFCSRARTVKVTHQLMLAMKGMNRPRVQVLTVRSNTHALGEQLRSLRRNFARLRRRPFWKRTVRGGIYVLEVTLNKRTGLWHPHLHIVYDGEYLPVKQLRYHWHQVTGDSEIVWIQDVSDLRGIANELCKYIGKPQHQEDFTDQQIREYYNAVSGSRMVQAFGILFGGKVEDRDHEDPLPADTYTVSLSHLVWLTKRGAETPAKLLCLISQRWKIFASYIHHELPQLAPKPSAPERTAKLFRVLRAGARAPPGTSTDADDTEKLDARLFLIFTRYRQEDQRGDYVIHEVRDCI